PHDEVAAYFKATDVGLYPGDANAYFDAACPIKVLEYSAAGRPVVATDLAELRRLALPNVLLAPPEPRAFGAAIVRALRDPVPLANVYPFDWEVLTTTFEDACAAIVSEGRVGAARLVPAADVAN